MTRTATLAQQSAANLALRAQAARNDPAAFLEFAWRTPEGEPIQLAYFHREWIHLATRRQRFLVKASKGLGKTSLLLGLAMWEIGRNHNIRIKIACATDSNARKRVFELLENIRNNPLIKLVFPDLRLSETGEKNKLRFTVDRTGNFKDATVEAAGILTSVGGDRSDLLIADDIVDYKNCIFYPALRETVKQKFSSEWLGTLEPRGRVWYIANPMHRSDVTSYLSQAPGWTIHTVFNGLGDDPYQPVWPEKQSREFLIQKAAELGTTEYNRAYRGFTLDADLITIKPEWIQFYTPDLLGDPYKLVCVQAYDLALAQKKKSDFFAHVSLLYDPKRNFVFVADAFHTKLSFPDQCKKVVELHDRWRPEQIGIESVGYQDSLAQSINERAAVPLPIVPMRPHGSKERRLAECVPVFENKRLFFNPRLDAVRDPRVLERGDIIAELLDFPMGTHDDMVDAFAYGVSLLRYYRVESEDEEFYEGEGMRTRVSLIAV